MKRAGEKLRSNRGASLFVALLLFLVCAVVGSAVLTAGTAASGRMSQIAESDQRFYSVNSTAGLLIDLLQDVTVKSERVEDTGGAPAIKVYKVDPVTKTYVLAERGDSLPLEIAYRLAENDGSGSVKLTLSSSDPAVTLPTAITGTTINGSISKDKLSFEIKSPKTADDDPVYSMTVTFAADIHETKSEKTVGSGTGARTITTTETSITWKLSDVK